MAARVGPQVQRLVSSPRDANLWVCDCSLRARFALLTDAINASKACTAKRHQPFAFAACAGSPSVPAVALKAVAHSAAEACQQAPHSMRHPAHATHTEGNVLSRSWPQATRWAKQGALGVPATTAADSGSPPPGTHSLPAAAALRVVQLYPHLLLTYAARLSLAAQHRAKRHGQHQRQPGPPLGGHNDSCRFLMSHRDPLFSRKCVAKVRSPSSSGCPSRLHSSDSALSGVLWMRSCCLWLDATLVPPKPGQKQTSAVR